LRANHFLFVSFTVGSRSHRQLYLWLAALFFNLAFVVKEDHSCEESQMNGKIDKENAYCNPPEYLFDLRGDE